jgi:NADPH-dependent F420 reductase
MQTMTERATPSVDGLVIGILGGTGDQGRGLARRFALAGHQVIIGSRSPERAAAAAQEIGHGVQGHANADAARGASVVIAAVPWEGHGDLLSGLAAELAGKIVVDCVNPLGFDQRGAYALPAAEGGPAEGSAAQQAAALLPGSRVVAAFHHVSAVLLLDPEVDTIDLDVMVLGDDREADPRRARHLRGPPAQLRSDRGADRQPGIHQPPVQGPRRPAGHRHLIPNGPGFPHPREGGGSLMPCTTPSWSPVISVSPTIAGAE